MHRFQVKDPAFLPHLSCEVDFSLNKGELLAFVGENGLGKTTLVQRFSKLLNVSIVEQKASDYFFDRSLKKVKEIFLSSNLSEEAHRNFERYWRRFNLQSKEDRYLSSLSGGEGQALKICLAMSIPKDVYILDEPSLSLDVQAKEQLCLLITELLQGGKSFIVIEHDTSWLPKPVRVQRLESRDQTLVLGDSWTI